MDWVTVRIKASGQIQEMVPHIARALIAQGRAEEYKPVADKPGTPVLETATMPAPQTALFVRMPRTIRKPITGRV